MDILGTFLTSLIGGPLTGILGGGIQMLFMWLGEKTKIQRIKAEAEAQERIIKAKIEAAKFKAEGEADVAHQNAVAESHRADQDNFVPRQDGLIYFLYGCIEVFKKFIRPGLAVYLTFIVTKLYYDLTTIGGMAVVLASDQRYIWIGKLIEMFIYLFGVCVSWYYVTRHSLKPPKD